ncbi:hypothetical protein HOY80DRAFT_1027744 [Tuber brumale]|nr:hypothetical protein HOY80DRAFT_1027744 [Tuber brumale]
MSASSMPENPTFDREYAMGVLIDLVEALSQTYAHRLSITEPTPGDTSPQYVATVECDEEDFYWEARFWADTGLKRIMRCKKPTGDTDPNEPHASHQQVLNFWHAFECDNIVQLFQDGDLRKGWWNHPIPAIYAPPVALTFNEYGSNHLNNIAVHDYADEPPSQWSKYSSDDGDHNTSNYVKLKGKMGRIATQAVGHAGNIPAFMWPVAAAFVGGVVGFLVLSFSKRRL